MKAYSMITDDRLGQYRSRARAEREATSLTRSTGVKHYAMFTTTYRDLEPRTCWTVVVE